MTGLPPAATLQSAAVFISSLELPMSNPLIGAIDFNNVQQVETWLRHFGITISQLHEAVDAVGGDPQAVTEHLLHQGGSAGVG